MLCIKEKRREEEEILQARRVAYVCKLLQKL